MSEMEKNLPNIEDEIHSLTSLLNKADTKPPKFEQDKIQQEQSISFTSSFMIEMIDFVKKALININNVNFLSISKFEDAEFRKYSRKIITENIKKIDSILNQLLNYIHINTPIIKKNTIHLILEDILEASEKTLQNKNIKIFKKYEKDLPETFIHDEQVRFILNSCFQYAVLSIPPNGSIGLLTRSIQVQKGTTEDKVVTLKERQYVEIRMVSTAHEDPFEQLENVSETPSIKADETLRLILRLIKELIQKHQGMIEFGVDEQKTRTIISLRLPDERRQVVLYEPIQL